MLGWVASGEVGGYGFGVLMVRRLVFGLVTVGFLLAVPRAARAVVVERVVAVIGEKAILLSDLRHRARPFLVQLHVRCPLGTPPCIPAENKIYGQLLERVVNEELERQAAARSNITVSSADVDKTLQRIARIAKMSLTQLYNDVRAQSGMTEQEYRREIRRQVLEGKLVQRLVQNQVRITQQELDSMYHKVVKHERSTLLYQPSWIALNVGKNPTKEHLATMTKEARQIVELARSGSKFSQLARQHSDAPKASENGGDLGVRAPAGSRYHLSKKYKSLVRGLEKVAMGLKRGEITGPFRFEDALVVMKLTNRQPSRYTSPEAARNEMIQRVQGEKLEHAKKKWLTDLRRRTHVDVRL